VSLLSNSEVIPMCLVAVVRYLTRVASAGAEDVQTIDRLLTHLNLRAREDQEPEGGMKKRVAETCSEFLRIGLFSTTDDGKLQLSPSLPAAARDPSTAESLLPGTVADLALRPEGDEAFGLALAWLLSLDPLSAPGSWDELAKAETRPEDSPERRLSDMAKSVGIQNDTRFGQLRHWSCYLGFAWTHALQGSVRIVPDPTLHLRWRLRQIFGVSTRLTMPVFADRLGRACQVLEGGEMREAAPKLQPDRAGVFSKSTSLALLRLDDERVIELEARQADSDRVLLDVDGQFTPFTHIRLRLEEVNG